MTECGERHPGADHEHKCYRKDGHYDDHLCEFCDFDWSFTQWRRTPTGWEGNRDAATATPEVAVVSLQPAEEK